MEFIVEVNHVTKAYGDVSFQIPEGQIMGFLGPNGSGKTTSIKLILGLTKPGTGSIQVFGKDPFKDRKIKYKIGYVPENDCFYRWISAYDFLVQYSRYLLPREVAKRRAMEVLEEVELAHVAHNRIQTFSKGMKQRIKLGQALIHKPNFVIADEPFNGLDPIVRKQFFDLMKKYTQEYETTFFVSSHVLFEVERLAKVITLLYKGRTIAQGGPSRIRAMIQEQPHSIQITTQSVKDLVKHMIDYTDSGLITGIEFTKKVNELEESFIVETKNPAQFYSLLTDLVVDYNLPVTEIKPTDEGLEALFKTLTVG